MGRVFVASLCCVLALASGVVSSAQQQQQLTVNIANGSAGSLIEFAINAGKVGETTVDAGGSALSILDVSNLGKVRVEVYVEVCVDGRTVVRIVQEGETVPEDENCNRRRVGAFLLDDGMRLSIDVQAMTAEVSGGGLSTGTKILIGAGAAGVGTALIVGGGGDDTGTPPPTPTPPAPVPNPFQSLNGRVFPGIGTRQTNNCNFFAQSASITITINNVNTDGIGTLTKVHTDTGVTFVHQINVTGSGTVFNVTTDTITLTIGGQTFLSQITELQINGNTLTGNQRFTRDLGGPNECHDHYALLLNATSTF
jgi:hypothetical protein